MALEICGSGCVVEGTLARVLRLDAEGYDFIVDPQEALRQIRTKEIGADLFTFVGRPDENAPRYNLPSETDNFACLNVTSYEQWLAEQVDFRVRNKIRKAGKAGVVVRELSFDDVLVQGISRIYNESAVRQGKPFWHYNEAVDEVRRRNATFLERSIFIGAFLEGELIGFIKMVTSQDGALAGLMQILSMMQHRDKAPTNALLAQAVRSCAERGVRQLHYARFTYGNKQSDGLVEFKRVNGFVKVDVPRYYVPLTARGRIALRLGLHRGAKRWVPNWVVAGYRTLRAAWYGRKAPALRSA